MRIPWSDEENALLVADYFDMLSKEVRGRPYVKVEHTRAIQPLLNGRTRQSIESKRQNVSAILKALGEVWINGYKPRFHWQDSLVDAVAEWLDDNPNWLAREPAWSTDSEIPAGPIPLFPPPTLNNQPEPNELEQTLELASKQGVADRDERNRRLGNAGEKLVYENEKRTLRSEGMDALAEQVRWVSKEDGDGAGYDISSFELDGSPRLLEVKTTNGWDRTPFYITRNELRVANRRNHEWVLYRVYDFSTRPRAFELRPPLEAHVSLAPSSFMASFN